MEQTHNTYTGEKTHWPCWKIQNELSLMPLVPWGKVYPVLPSSSHHFHHIFGRSHKPTQQHREKTLVCLAPEEAGGGMSFTWVLTPALKTWWCWFIPGCRWPWMAGSVNDESLSASGSCCSCSRDSFSKQMNFCYLQLCVLRWTSIHFSLFKPGPPAESVRRAPYTCQTPNAGQ